MKKKYTTLLALFLAALTLLTACAVRSTPDTPSTELSQSYTYTYADSEETDVYSLSQTAVEQEEIYQQNLKDQKEGNLQSAMQ